MLELWQANAQGKYAHPEDTQEKPEGNLEWNVILQGPEESVFFVC